MFRHYQGSLDGIVLLQVNPKQTKKQPEDDDRVMENNHENNRRGEQEPKERDDSETGSELTVPEELNQYLWVSVRDGDTVDKKLKGADRVMKDTTL